MSLEDISGFGNILVSDDAKHAFLALESGSYLIDISSKEDVPKSNSNLEKYKISNGTGSNFIFLNNSEAYFIGSKGEIPVLYHYDINNREKKEVLEYVSNFILSNNGKYITYSSNSTLYVGPLNNYKITDPTIIFKGNIGSRMWWNKDNNKLVFQGSEQGTSNLKQFVAEFKH